MRDVLLGLGGNLGDPAGAIRGALGRLTARGVAIRQVSSLYRTPPWGPVPQPDFLNACAAGETDLAPDALLAAAKEIERELGRAPGPRWGPRAIDIDILALGDLVLNTPDLTLPHPRLTERAFVLVPLAEIVPERVVGGRTVADWMAGADAAGISKVGPHG